MKQMMERMRDERGVVMYVDLHGHSVKKNVFIYGCDAKHFDTVLTLLALVHVHKYKY